MDHGQERLKTDFLVIGSGIAGLVAALKAADVGSVVIVTKKSVVDGSSSLAQGGIACVVGEDDSLEAHVRDTLEAGAGICREDVVRQVVAAGPERLRELIELGVSFTRRAEMDPDHDATPDSFDLGREGGHSHRRVLHKGDITGRELIRVLRQRCLEHPNIRILENHHAIDLISSRRLGWDGPNRCLGAYVLECGPNRVHIILGKLVFLATGGVGRVYQYTTNPDVAAGEGVAMAYRAYAEIANMEFLQFHPTLLFHPLAKSFLISEAVRGEGAVLKIKSGDDYQEFMADYHELRGLAPRDVVARAIDRELKRGGQPCAWLDIRRQPESFLRKRFPNIFQTCLDCGINMATDLVPVVPAAHYCCGGVRTDVNGRTCVEGLYAIGEVGCTGLHGANRLASNSLLEAVVVAHNAVETARRELGQVDSRHLENGSRHRPPDWSRGKAVDADEMIVIYHNWDEIRRFMWDYVGIFRTNKRLARAKQRANMIRREIETNYWDFVLTPELVELHNMASVAEMIVDSALARTESIGLHYNADCPQADPASAGQETILRRAGFEKMAHWHNI